MPLRALRDVGLAAVEGLLMIEAGSAATTDMPAGRSEIVCSLPGAVDDALPRQPRPDLNK